MDRRLGVAVFALQDGVGESPEHQIGVESKSNQFILIRVSQAEPVDRSVSDVVVDELAPLHHHE